MQDPIYVCRRTSHMDSARLFSISNADGFIFGTVKFFVLSLGSLVLCAVSFGGSILLTLLTAERIAVSILLQVHGVLFVSIMAGKLSCNCYQLRKERSVPKRTEGANEFDGEYLKNLTGLPAIFSYETIKITTGGFSKEIGKGGFGAVYEGILEDGTPVAVKCLVNQSRQGQEEFCAEIAAISSINHSNLVRLRGICVEGAHRILVYEFMANGSLDRWLFAPAKRLDWKTRYSIALDTARGLAYLHEDSRLCILHLDVKPQNILVDENFKAKISDFGMAKCLKRDMESYLMTGVRGTPGYIAPEWIWAARITTKSDVFSYGMVLLEIISGRRNVDNSQDSDNWYFPAIAFSKARQEKMEELIDRALELKCPQSVEEAYRLIKTALWCIQSDSALRPSMGAIVRILEGSLDIMDPPLDCTLPFAPSVADHVTPTSCTTIEIAGGLDGDIACEGI